MSIYAISDLHGNLPNIPSDAELLLLAGDICPDFRPYGRRARGWVDESGTQQANWLDTVFRAWLATSSAEVVAIWGNHDFIGERRSLIPGLPWTLLEDSMVEAQGHHIYGTPWVPGLPYWAFYGDDRRLKMRADAIPDDLDVLMTHGPPHGLGDFIPTSIKQREKYGNQHGAHVGDPTLNEVLLRAKPRVVLCGHIHEARGGYYDKESGAIVNNVAAVDEAYNLHPQPWLRIA